MNNLPQYVFEVILGSSVLFLGYYLTKNFIAIAFRRFFLLSCLVLPLVFPLISFNSSEQVVIGIPNQVNLLFEAPIQEINTEIASINSSTAIDVSLEQINDSPIPKADINWINLAVFIYFIVAAFLLIRMGFSLFSLIKLIRNPKAEFNGTRIYVVDQQHFSGGSFFNHIFINKKYLNDPVVEIILAHEQTHARLWHSVDILLSEFYCIVFWLNPVAWFLRNEIRLNTEYQADQLSLKGFDRQSYSNTLLNLSIHAQNLQPVISFSAINIKNRIQYILRDKKYHWSRTLLAVPFLVIATWLISCEPEVMDFAAMDPEAALKNVKSVTTRYISHQKDTQQKDGKVIAIAYYLPDGTVDRVEQHMTYPYDFEKPFKREFLASPDPVGVLHILDGFHFGHAENNFLYGNDWPKYNKIDLFRAKSELYRKSTTIDKNEEGLPVKFTLTEELNEDLFYNGTKRGNKGSVVRMLIEEYKYIDGKVFSFTRKSESPESISIMTFKNQTYKVGGSRLLTEMNYKYEGENLIEVSGHSQGHGSPETTKMEYQNGIMKSSSYYRKNTKYHYREFFYDDSGLKTRTEIYNVYGEPEYTITYDYDYY